MRTVDVIILSGSLFMFVLTYLLLQKTRRLYIRLIPVYLYAVLWTFALLSYAGMFGGNDGGFFEAGKLLGLMIFVFSAVWLSGAAAAVLLFFLVKYIRKRNG